jgi:aldehyde:ferredoxin oxidoreductase
VYTLTRLINVRLGTSRKDDTMPWKVFNVPIRSGPTAGKVIDRQQFEKLLDLYPKGGLGRERRAAREGLGGLRLTARRAFHALQW